ncbi:hypothetical protein [Streptosporangium longisporum]|uniref:Uncharacterized protein n=1 Tax=Streptosporangium longisporum TaxID=46187 RepID=A0ABP6KA21_9ACTN
MAYAPAPAPAREEFLGLLEHLGLTDHSGTGDLPGPPPGRILTGITDLDAVLIDLPAGGTLTAVASRPGVGSTTLLLAFC